MNKKNLTIAIIVFIITTIFLVIIVIGRDKNPEQTIKEAISSDSLQEYFDESLLASIADSEISNTDFLKENVSNYEATTAIKSTKEIERSSTQAILMVEIEKKIINKKTGFSVITIDTYEVGLIRTGEAWKINQYQIIESKTIR